jgi:hypothetical protein
MIIVVGLLALIAVGIGTMLVNLTEGESAVSLASFWIGIILIGVSLYLFFIAMFFPDMANSLTI